MENKKPKTQKAQKKNKAKTPKRPKTTPPNPAKDTKNQKTKENQNPKTKQKIPNPFKYTLYCYRSIRTKPISDFVNFIKNILDEENIDPKQYSLASKPPHTVYINFSNTNDMETIYQNHKYGEYEGRSMSITTKYDPKQSPNANLVFHGLPNDITRKELDDILTEKYKFCVHQVSKIETSYEDENFMYAFVKFEFDEDALICLNTVKEIRGYPVKIRFRTDTDDNSSTISENIFI